MSYNFLDSEELMYELEQICSKPITKPTPRVCKKTLEDYYKDREKHREKSYECSLSIFNNYCKRCEFIDRQIHRLATRHK